jgi:hypothetical protein
MKLLELFFGKIPEHIKKEKEEQERIKKEEETKIIFEKLENKVKTLYGKFLYFPDEKNIDEKVLIFNKVSLRENNQITIDLIPAKYFKKGVVYARKVFVIEEVEKLLFDRHSDFLELESTLKTFGFVFNEESKEEDNEE